MLEKQFFVEQSPTPGTPLTPTSVALFQPLKIKNVTLKNRIAVSPMCICKDGFMTDFHVVHLGSFAMKGAALVICEATAVAPNGRISPQDAGLWKDEHIAPMKRVNDFIHSMGGLSGIQLAHAGRKASTLPPWEAAKNKLYGTVGTEANGWKEQVVGASAIPWDETHVNPHELTQAEIADLVNAFRDSAVRAEKAGFDVIEIHGAHGYLISSFLSPTSNQRTDNYGGTFENRIRFLLEIVKAIRSVWSDEKPLFLRISCEEWVANGWHVEDSVRLASVVKNLGVDLIDCSSGAFLAFPFRRGNNSKQRIIAKPGFQVPFAHEIKKKAGMLAGAVGILTEPKQCDDVIRNGEADLILLAREFLRDSEFVLRAAQELDVQVKWANQYERGKRSKM
ncbi:oxidoreductase, FAD/FMN-binding protein [Paraphysoderma sedebokerense]|nr:oxidoreductase, FAD/FMN-binding protein [Paraphysoderma sedebokerense]